MLDLAKLEIDGRPLWKYHSCPFEDGEMEEEDEEEFDEPKTGGAAIDCYHDEEGNNVYKYTRKLQHGHKAKLERQLIEFMIGLQDAVKDHIPRVPLQTKHTWCGETFCAHTWFCGAIWRDWVFIDWGDDGGELPSKISSFVDLSELPEDAGISYGGVQQLSPGVYAIVESAKFLKTKCLVDMLDLFVPICKDHGKLVNGSAVCYKYYLADVEGFKNMTVVIPNLGGQTNDYFVLKSWEDWKEVFHQMATRW
jgi:hypothetical protein